MIKAMKKIFFNFILLGTLLMSTLISAQVVLTALEAPNGFTSTQTRSYTGTFTKNNCSRADYRGTSVIYTQSATATATSTISQADADRLAANAATAEAQKLVNQDGQAYANQYGKCEPNVWYRCSYFQQSYFEPLEIFDVDDDVLNYPRCSESGNITTKVTSVLYGREDKTTEYPLTWTEGANSRCIDGIDESGPWPDVWYRRTRIFYKSKITCEKTTSP